MIVVDKVESEEKEINLTLQDRCDGCGAQAFVYVKGLAGELYFCGHHYNKSEEEIKRWAFTIVDQRDRINQKSESSN